METSTEINSIAEALSKAQAAFPAIERKNEVEVTMKSGGKYKYKYADLAYILSATRKPLADNGLCLVQAVSGLDGKQFLTTMLAHASGQYFKSTTPLPNSTDMQDLGSSITYRRRYDATAMIGIAADEDDDAGSSKPLPEQPKSAQKQKPAPKLDFKAELEKSGWTIDEGKKYAEKRWPGIKMNDAMAKELLAISKTMPPKDAIFSAEPDPQK